MSKNAVIVIYLLAMASSVFIMDILFFRHRFWERLMVNIGIVLVYAAFYLAFLNKR